MYVAGLRFLVRFGGECDSYINWVVLECMIFSAMVASSGESRGGAPPPILGEKSAGQVLASYEQDES